MKNTIRNATLCFLIKRNGIEISQICLAMKKRGFGQGRWNGVGGKVEPDETIEEATIRETQEEIGVRAIKTTKVAVLTFLFPFNPTWDQIVHVYLCFEWQGNPQESDGMRPEWFKVNELPFKNMWADDVIWLPQVLAGKKVLGTFSFGDGDVVLNHKIELVKTGKL